MSLMKLYFVRHGESTGNEQGIHQDSQTPLSTKGLQQAEELAQRFESIHIDSVLCSPFVRTKQTAEAIIKSKNIEVGFDDRLVETKRPTEIEGKSIHDPDVLKIKEEIKINNDNPDWYYSDEEKPADVMKRVADFLTDVKQRKEESILIVTHGEAIRTVVLLMMYGEEANVHMWEHFKSFLWVSNTAITLLSDHDGTWKLITWNDHAHLGERRLKRSNG